jgi:hypothetical protein
VTLFGLTYLQEIVDLVTGGAMHIEPGIWVHIPSQDVGTTQSVARMGNIPHGNSLLAEGVAIGVNPVPGGTFDIDKISAVNAAPFAAGANFGSGRGCYHQCRLTGVAKHTVLNLLRAAALLSGNLHRLRSG